MDELKTYELRDPAALIREVAGRPWTLAEDTAWLALIHHPVHATRRCSASTRCPFRPAGR